MHVTMQGRELLPRVFILTRLRYRYSAAGPEACCAVVRRTKASGIFSVTLSLASPIDSDLQPALNWYRFLVESGLSSYFQAFAY